MRSDTANLNTAPKRTLASARVVWPGAAIRHANGGGGLEQ